MSMFRRRLMIANALRKSDGNINYPNLIAAWSAKGKTNDEDRATLKDLTGNEHDITLNGFAFSEMSGYGGYGINTNNFMISSLGTEKLNSTKFKLFKTPSSINNAYLPSEETGQIEWTYPNYEYNSDELNSILDSDKWNKEEII